MDGFDLNAHGAVIDREGDTLFPDLLSPQDLAEVRRVLASYLGSRSGRYGGYRAGERG